MCHEAQLGGGRRVISVAYDVVLLLHVLSFVYWLGADLGVFYGARFAANPRFSLETRVTVADIMAFVDLFPRLCVPIAGVSGITLAVLSGQLSPGPLWLWAALIVAGVWIAFILWIYANRKQRQKISVLVAVDPWLRAFVLVILLLMGVVALTGQGITQNMSIAVKLLIYAAAIFMSLVLRHLFRPYRPALARLVAGSGTQEDDAIMQDAFARTRPAVLLLWACTIAAASVGLWQPF